MAGEEKRCLLPKVSRPLGLQLSVFLLAADHPTGAEKEHAKHKNSRALPQLPVYIILPARNCIPLYTFICLFFTFNVSIICEAIIKMSSWKKPDDTNEYFNFQTAFLATRLAIYNKCPVWNMPWEMVSCIFPFVLSQDISHGLDDKKYSAKPLWEIHMHSANDYGHLICRGRNYCKG